MPTDEIVWLRRFRPKRDARPVLRLRRQEFGRAHFAPPADVATAFGLRAEHDAVLPLIDQIRSVATVDARLRPRPGAHLVEPRLEGELLPHERADEELLVPLVDRALGGTDATAA